MATRTNFIAHIYTKKRTSIGNSSVRSRPKNKHTKRMKKAYRGQG